MTPVAVFEAKNRLSELIAIAERGEEVSITRRGVAVARLVAVDRDAQADVLRQVGVRDIFAQLHRLRESIDIDGELKQLAREGLA